MKLKQVQTIETFAQGMFRQKDVLRNFAKFTGKHLCQRLYFNKFAGLRLQLSLKRDSVTGVFLCIFGKFLRTHFLTTPPVAASETKNKIISVAGLVC